MSTRRMFLSSAAAALLAAPSIACGAKLEIAPVSSEEFAATDRQIGKVTRILQEAAVPYWRIRPVKPVGIFESVDGECRQVDEANFHVVLSWPHEGGAILASFLFSTTSSDEQLAMYLRIALADKEDVVREESADARMVANVTRLLDATDVHSWTLHATRYPYNIVRHNGEKARMTYPGSECFVVAMRWICETGESIVRSFAFDRYTDDDYLRESLMYSIESKDFQVEKCGFRVLPPVRTGCSRRVETMVC